MARIFMTGLESGSLGAFLTTEGTAAASTTQKRTGAYSLYCQQQGDGATASLPGVPAEIYVRFGYYPTSIQSGSRSIMTIYDSSGVQHLALTSETTTCLLMARRGSTGLSTSSVPLVENVWNLIECHLKIDDVSGVFDVKLNGVSVITFAGDTRNAGSANIFSVKFGTGLYNANAGAYFDDIAINDTTGAVNNGWIGQGGIYLVHPDGNSPDVGPNWTPSAGDNYACVDEIPASDADYVSSPTVDAIDLYTVDESHLPASGTVSAVKFGYRAKVTDGGAVLNPVIRSGGTTEQQTSNDLALSSSFAVVSKIYDVNPVSDAAWTLATVGAMEFGQAKGS